MEVVKTKLSCKAWLNIHYIFLLNGVDLALSFLQSDLENSGFGLRVVILRPMTL